MGCRCGRLRVSGIWERCPKQMFLCSSSLPQKGSTSGKRAPPFPVADLISYIFLPGPFLQPCHRVNTEVGTRLETGILCTLALCKEGSPEVVWMPFGCLSGLCLSQCGDGMLQKWGLLIVIRLWDSHPMRSNAVTEWKILKQGHHSRLASSL